MIRRLAELLASGSEEIVEILANDNNLESQTSSLALRVVLVAAIALFVLVAIASKTNARLPKLKAPLFILIALSMAGSTAILIGSTINLNLSSDSGGPVHWHSAIEYWACGNQLEFRDPGGKFSNKVGSSAAHEHDDQLLHIEGVIVDRETDSSLGGLLASMGVFVSVDELFLPLNESPARWLEDAGSMTEAQNTALLTPFIESSDEFGTVAELRDGQLCGTETADVQTYVYQFDEENDVYWQEKLNSPETYVIKDNPNVPPGNCVIVEFGPTAERTNKLCVQYGIRDIDRCKEFGVEESKTGICTIREVGMVTDDGQIIELSSLQDSEPAKVQKIEGLE